MRKKKIIELQEPITDGVHQRNDDVTFERKKSRKWRHVSSSCRVINDQYWREKHVILEIARSLRLTQS